MKEIWKDIPGYEGMYQVSNLGRVKGLERDTKRPRPQHVQEQILKPRSNQKRGGYLQVHLADAGKHKAFFVHRLVAMSFLENPENKPIVNHKDGNKHNNCVDNLEWCTQKENVFHAFATGLNIPVRERRNCLWNIVVEERDGKFSLIEYHRINSN